MRSETIFAAASGFGRAAVCVIRISGSQAGPILVSMTGTVPPPRRLVLRRISDPADGTALDQGLVAWMPGPRSFTGEDQAEIHIHGGIAVRTAVLRALSGFDACRAAEPGEFTRRAFLNGRLDLSRIEGLADLIDAETEAQRRQALRQLEGRLGTVAEAWRAQLLEALALLEAALDFSDEGDVAETVDHAAFAIAATVHRDIRRYLDDGSRGERLRDGFTVVIAGPPNAGKSTLLNALAQRDVAIVSPYPGTTRDALEVRCDLDGLPVLFVDTAGLRPTADPIEQQGVAQTRKRAASADLVLWLTPLDEPAPPPMDVSAALVVGTKADLTHGGPLSGADLAISAQTGAGLQDLLAQVTQRAQAMVGAGDSVITRERHRSALVRAASALKRALDRTADSALELATEDVRLAARAVGEITGRVDVDHVLDRLFASMCIGK